MPNRAEPRWTALQPRIRLLLCLLVATLAFGCVSLQSPIADPKPEFKQPEEREFVEPEERRPITYDQALAKADQLRGAGQVPEAVWYYVRALSLDDASPIPRQRIAYLHLGKDVIRAEDIFTDLVHKHPQMPSARVGLGLAEYANGKPAKARKTLEFALALDPDSAIAYTTLGLIEDDSGNHELARQHYRHAQRLASRRYEIPNNLGMSYLMTDSYDQAEAAFSQAVYLNPNDPAVLNNLAYTIGRTGKYEKALRSFRKTGTEAIALNNTGYTAYLNGEYDKAIEYYERALLLDDQSQREHILVNLRTAENALLGR